MVRHRWWGTWESSVYQPDMVWLWSLTAGRWKVENGSRRLEAGDAYCSSPQFTRGQPAANRWLQPGASYRLLTVSQKSKVIDYIGCSRCDRHCRILNFDFIHSLCISRLDSQTVQQKVWGSGCRARQVGRGGIPAARNEHRDTEARSATLAPRCRSVEIGGRQESP
jgi:hypothetical protein